MRAISLWQPWGSLWLSPRKVHETRHWDTSYRGGLLVHAAKRMERTVSAELAAILTDEFGPDWATILPTGALIGRVNLVDCIPTEVVTPTDDDYQCGNFEPDRFAWKRDSWVRYRQPIPYKGRQGFFNVDEELLAPAMREDGPDVAIQSPQGRFA